MLLLDHVHAYGLDHALNLVLHLERGVKNDLAVAMTMLLKVHRNLCEVIGF